MIPRDIMDPNDSTMVSGLKSIASRLGVFFEEGRALLLEVGHLTQGLGCWMLIDTQNFH